MYNAKRDKKPLHDDMEYVVTMIDGKVRILRVRKGEGRG